MADVKRVTKRLEIHLGFTSDGLSEDQARAAADGWINQHERNEDVYAWEFATAYVSRQTDESWVVVYTQ